MNEATLDFIEPEKFEKEINATTEGELEVRKLKEKAMSKSRIPDKNLKEMMQQDLQHQKQNRM